MPESDFSKDDELRLDAFLSGKLSADDCAKFKVWLSRKYGVNADILREATDAFFAGKDEPRMSSAQVTRLRQELKKTIDADIGERKRAPRPTPVKRPLWGSGIAPRVFAGSVSLSHSDERKTPRPNRVYLLIKIRGDHARLLRQRYREEHADIFTFRSVAAAIEKLKDIPLDTKVSVRHGSLTTAESAALRAAIKARPTAVHRTRVSEADNVSVENTRPSDMPPASPVVPTKPKRRR